MYTCINTLKIREIYLQPDCITCDFELKEFCQRIGVIKEETPTNLIRNSSYSALRRYEWYQWLHGSTVMYAQTYELRRIRLVCNGNLIPGQFEARVKDICTYNGYGRYNICSPAYITYFSGK